MQGRVRRVEANRITYYYNKPAIFLCSQKKNVRDFNFDVLELKHY